ncbi:MAG: hypothetical protein HS108_00005 [Planctomycetes bacterium]|jgi:hypothetical protein|nr:hypothetical protein [Planctomycetota bacterium]MCL4732056.1 hypothetical protein [Planctomycetota bacterium]
MESMRPSTLVALVILVALIFVPAFFISVNDVRDNALPDANGREPPPPPPREPVAPANRSPVLPPANDPPAGENRRPAGNSVVD